MAALQYPGAGALLTQWDPQPLALVVAVVAAGWYARAVRRLGMPWPARRSLLFGLGLLGLVWTTCGYPQAYASSLFWAWSSQTLVLLLVVPWILLLGQPLQLARALGTRGVERFLRSRFVRLLSNPLIGPAAVPLLSVALFFGPVSAWTIQTPALGWVLHLVLVLVGALIMLPLVGIDDEPSSLAVGLSLAIGSFELILDAVPGIVLRLNTHLVTSYFDHRVSRPWSPSPLHDQQIAGSVLWCVSEVIDLPFLLLVYRRWLRADARDAAQVDAVLEAERASRATSAVPAGQTGQTGQTGQAHSEAPSDAPWWLSDPSMQARLRRRD